MRATGVLLFRLAINWTLCWKAMASCSSWLVGGLTDEFRLTRDVAELGEGGDENRLGGGGNGVVFQEGVGSRAGAAHIIHLAGRDSSGAPPLGSYRATYRSACWSNWRRRAQRGRGGTAR